MKQSIKDQLLSVLDTEEMCKQCHYNVEALRRKPDVDPEHLLAWEIRLSSEIRCISYIQKIVAISKEVDSSICVFAYYYDNNYILLL